jgi:hypothetical protein
MFHVYIALDVQFYSPLSNKHRIASRRVLETLLMDPGSDFWAACVKLDIGFYMGMAKMPLCLCKCRKLPLQQVQLPLHYIRIHLDRHPYRGL